MINTFIVRRNKCCLYEIKMQFTGSFTGVNYESGTKGNCCAVVYSRFKNMNHILSTQLSGCTLGFTSHLVEIGAGVPIETGKTVACVLLTFNHQTALDSKLSPSVYLHPVGYMVVNLQMCYSFYTSQPDTAYG